MPKLLPTTLGLVVVAIVAATSINHYQSATASGVYQIAAARGAAKKKAPASGKCNPMPGSGTLELRFQEDLPAEAAGISVSITGPRRWSRTGITPGRNYIYQRVPTGKYTVTVSGAAPRRFESHEIVDTAFFLSADPLNPCVPKNGTARVTVRYVVEPGSGKMWVVSSHALALAISRSSLAETNSQPRPTTVINNFFNELRGLAMDRDGNLWVLIAGYGMRRIPRDMLGRDQSTARPDIQIKGHWENSALSMAFGPDGALWIVQSDRIIKFTTDQLMRSGTQEPTAIIRGPDVTNASRIAFDRSGNLWVTNSGGAPHSFILKFGAERLRTSYNGPADAAISATLSYTRPGPPISTREEPLVYLSLIAFDEAGNLWTRSGGSYSWIVRIPSAELASSGNKTTSEAWEISAGADMAFDNEGTLWVGTAQVWQPKAPAPNRAYLFGLTAEQLRQPVPEGNFVPARIIKPYFYKEGAASPGDTRNFYWLLNPSPSWSPINDR